MRGEEGGREGDPGWVQREEGPGPKLIVLGSIGVLLLILILQNTDEVDINMLFWDVQLPLWLVLGGAVVPAFAAGWLVGRFTRKHGDH
jgi:uncharacterized integral membrane protein